MFGLVKKLFGRKPEQSATPQVPAVATSAVRTPPKPMVTPAAQAAVLAAKAAANPTGVADQVQVSLLGIVGLLPQELRPVRALGDVAGVAVTFSTRPLLEQLSHGCVRVPFSEVRKRAPEGFFSAGSEHDSKLVELPLQEVLSQLGSRGFGRRKEQKTVTVPDEVTGLFSNRGDILSTNLKTSAPAQPASAGSAAPALPRSVTTPAPAAPAPAPQVHAAPAPAAQPQARVAFNPAANPAPAVGSSIPAPAVSPAPVFAPAPAPTPTPTPAPVAAPAAPVEAKSGPISGASLLQALQGQSPAAAKSNPAASQPAVAAVAPSPAVQTAGTSDASKELLWLPLEQVSATWPELVKAEIRSNKFASLKVGLPVDEVGLALSAGRIQYTWGRVLQLLEGGAGANVASSQSSVGLDIPLAMVAPLYMALKKGGKSGRSASGKGAGMNEITDLFYKDKASAAAAAAAMANSAAGTPAAAPAPAPVPVSLPPSMGAVPAVVPVPTPAPVVATPAAVAAAVPAPAVVPSANAGQVFGVPVAMINESWADGLKAELAKLNRPDLKVEMPFEEVNRALRAGKVEYTWRQLREWIKPPLPTEVGLEFSDKMLTLPLKVIAPMFLGQFKQGRTTKKVELETDIPDPFMGNVPGKQSQIEAAGGSGSGAAADKADARSESGNSSGFSTTQFMRKPPADLGELFGQPGKRNWTPQEIVQNTIRIRGLQGALITMEDGLLVAGQMNGALKAEATAAFIPQIYDRLKKYMTELGAGETHSVQINTAQGTLLVFKAGIIFFAVVGKPDEALPMAPIKLIAAELSRHAK